MSTYKYGSSSYRSYSVTDTEIKGLKSFETSVNIYHWTWCNIPNLLSKWYNFITLNTCY
jgi:hypothetical protein